MIKGDLDNTVSNVSATNADITWAHFDSSNYAWRRALRERGATNVKASILPQPLTIEFGTANESKIYDGKTLYEIFGEDNKVYTSADVYDGLDLTNRGWEGIFSRVLRTKDIWGGDIFESITSLYKGNYFVGIFSIAGYDYEGKYTIGITDASVGNEELGIPAYHNFTVVKNGEGWFIITKDEYGYVNYEITVYVDERQSYDGQTAYVIMNKDSQGQLYDRGMSLKREIKVEYNNLLQSWQAAQSMTSRRWA